MKVVNGTSYHDDTPDKLIEDLEYARLNGLRVRLFYGDTLTGRDWGEEHDVCGFLGRSTGPNKIPILMYNVLSMGGPGILDHCIVKLLVTGKYGAVTVAYLHPLYHHPAYSIKENRDPGYLYPELPYEMRGFQCEVVARFKTFSRANRWFRFMTGRRMIP